MPGKFGASFDSSQSSTATRSSRSSISRNEGDSLFAPHIRRAFKLHFEFSDLRADSAGTEAALDILPAGLIFLGTKGGVVLINRSSFTFVAERDRLLATRNRFAPSRLAEASLLEKTILQAASTSSGKGDSAGGTVMISRRSRPPLQIQISPIRNAVIQTSQSIAAVPFVNDLSRADRPTQEYCSCFYG